MTIMGIPDTPPIPTNEFPMVAWAVAVVVLVVMNTISNSRVVVALDGISANFWKIYRV